MPSRLETFRDYMARLDAAANPARALDRGFYVDRPGRATGGEIAARLALRPSSSHLLVGVPGSGKTTQLLVARDQLKRQGDTWAEYLDISERQDIGQMKPGVLIVLVGLALASALGKTNIMEAEIAKEMFNRWAHGYRGGPQIKNDSDTEWIPGLVTPPEEPLPPEMKQMAAELKNLRLAMAQNAAHHVLLIDSLDRLWDPVIFEQIVEHDIRAIGSSGLGVVVAGPQRSMYGVNRSIADRFDYFYHQPPVDVQEDAEGHKFLICVLRARLPAAVLPDESCCRLVQWSGGVLRDLVVLAQAACENTYFRGSEHIGEAEIDAAADAFGRKHLLGLGPDEIEILQRVRKTGSFVQTSDKDLALLATRRILEYQNGRTRYAVHPTVERLLEELATKP